MQQGAPVLGDRKKGCEMITIINYGLGNIKAFINVYDKLHIPVTTASNCHELKKATKIILPGVGSFDNAMIRLEKSGMKDLLAEMVLIKEIPVLGVCVGMQILANSSEEGSLPGLGWVEGEVKRFETSRQGGAIRVPHMGWNTVTSFAEKGIFKGFDHKARFYFLHSYYFNSHNKDAVIATSDYDGEFACAVCSGNIYGVQFHPEKSHRWGIQFLDNFARLI
jgi:glutamine amidotransferase